MPDLLPISLDEVVHEVRRTLEVRQRRYPELVRSGRVNKRQLDRQNAVLEATLETLEREQQAAAALDAKLAEVQCSPRYQEWKRAALREYERRHHEA